MNLLDGISAIAKAPVNPIRAMAGEDVYQNQRANDAWRNVSKGHIFDAETWKGLARASHQDAVGPEYAEKWDNQVARSTGGQRQENDNLMFNNPGKSLEQIKYQQMLDAWMGNHPMQGVYQG